SSSPNRVNGVSWNWHLVVEVRRFNRLPWFHRASPSTTRNEIRCINECGYIDLPIRRCQMVFPGYHTETTETENLDRCFNDQTSHRRGARFGAGVGSEAI